MPSKSVTFPLNLCVDNADDKKAKRTIDTENLESGQPDRGKRVKCEQTEATDLSMKSSCSASQPRLGNPQVTEHVTSKSDSYKKNCLSGIDQ